MLQQSETKHLATNSGKSLKQSLTDLEIGGGYYSAQTSKIEDLRQSLSSGDSREHMDALVADLVASDVYMHKVAINSLANFTEIDFHGNPYGAKALAELMSLVTEARKNRIGSMKLLKQYQENGTLSEGQDVALRVQEVLRQLEVKKTG